MRDLHIATTTFKAKSQVDTTLAPVAAPRSKPPHLLVPSTTARITPQFQVPEGTTRIEESELKDLMKGPVHTLAFDL